MKKILIIEDDLKLQKIYQTSLTNEGYQVINASNSNKGLKFAKEEKPDLIVLDVMLPGGPDGFNVLETLKKNQKTKSIPVIIATNIDDQISTALQKGAVWYFVKAHTPIEDVIEKIKKILG